MWLITAKRFSEPAVESAATNWKCCVEPLQVKVPRVLRRKKEIIRRDAHPGSLHVHAVHSEKLSETSFIPPVWNSTMNLTIFTIRLQTARHAMDLSSMCHSLGFSPYVFGFIQKHKWKIAALSVRQWPESTHVRRGRTPLGHTQNMLKGLTYPGQCRNASGFPTSRWTWLGKRMPALLCFVHCHHKLCQVGIWTGGFIAGMRGTSDMV